MWRGAASAISRSTIGWTLHRKSWRWWKVSVFRPSSMHSVAIWFSWLVAHLWCWRVGSLWCWHWELKNFTLYLFRSYSRSWFSKVRWLWSEWEFSSLAQVWHSKRLCFPPSRIYPGISATCAPKIDPSLALKVGVGRLNCVIFRFFSLFKIFSSWNSKSAISSRRNCYLIHVKVCLEVFGVSKSPLENVKNYILDNELFRLQIICQKGGF
jgi:hypothetical protein